MTERYEVDILLVEDSPDDAEMTLHALRRERLVNRIFVARDGEEALDYEQFRETVKQVGMYWILMNQQPHPENLAERAAQAQ